jgi:hypothetical protein
MSLLYRLLCCLVGVLARGGGERELEIVVLRHQLAILRRGGKRPRYTTADRALLAAVSQLLPPERWSCFAVSPQTLRRWHRALLQGKRGRRGRRPGRPPLAAGTRSLILRIARENPRWGYMRIRGELLKLGISVSATTVATVLRVERGVKAVDLRALGVRAATTAPVLRGGCNLSSSRRGITGPTSLRARVERNFFTPHALMNLLSIIAALGVVQAIFERG